MINNKNFWCLEPYKCTGVFSEDFYYQCKQNELNYIPTIIPRSKITSSTISNETKIEKF